MTISNLHAEFITFAAGMPAVGISWDLIGRDVQIFANAMRGVNPGQPSAGMGNIPMPVYGLAFSVFVDRLNISRSGSDAVLEATISANIHPRGAPADVIYSYVIETINPVAIKLDYDSNTNELFWLQEGIVIPDISGQFSVNADAILANTTIPAPQRDTYLLEVDRQIRWLTGPTFISLVTDALSRYALGELAPWLRFRDPLRITATPSHVLVSANRATLMIGDCDPQSVEIEPDPNFPYGRPIPLPTFQSGEVDLALYVPRTRLFEFLAKTIEPAVLVSSSGGGVIKWSMSGSVGLKALALDILTAQGLSGVLWIRADVDFVAAARAWVDGPSGRRIGLASASVLGKGRFEAELILHVDLPGAFVEASLHVTHASLPNVDWDVNTPLGWPIDDVAGDIVDHISRKEIRKLVGRVVRVGRWSILGIPYRYQETLPMGSRIATSAEGLEGVSSVFCLLDRAG